MQRSTLTTVQAGRRPVRLTRSEAAALADLRELRGRPRQAAPPAPPDPEPEVAPTRTLAQQLAEAPEPGRPGSLRAQLQARRQRARVRTAAKPPVLDAPAAQDSETVPTTSMLTQFRRHAGGRK